VAAQLCGKAASGVIAAQLPPRLMRPCRMPPVRHAAASICGGNVVPPLADPAELPLCFASGNTRWADHQPLVDGGGI